MEQVKRIQSLKSTFTLLKSTFGIVPIVAGLDKFTNLLTTWENYIPQGISDSIPMAPHSFMEIIGLVEITAGIIVLTKPRIGGYIVAGWLTIIALLLLIGGQYLDVAVRDLVMAIGAFSMARLAKVVS